MGPFVLMWCPDEGSKTEGASAAQGLWCGQDHMNPYAGVQVTVVVVLEIVISVNNLYCS